MIPRKYRRPLLIWFLIFGGSIAGCLCERSTRKFDDFDFDLTPRDESDETGDDSDDTDSPEPLKTGRH